MHSLLLVVGENVHQRLHKFADYAKVEPYRVYVEGERLEQMAEYFKMPTTDLEALAARMPEWANCKAEIHAGKLCTWIRENPNSKFDFFKIGGRFTGYLRLRTPRQPSLLGRLIGRKATSQVNRAFKSEVETQAVVENPPYAILVGEAWVERGWSSEAPGDDSWRQQLAQRFAAVEESDMITVVDIHS